MRERDMPAYPCGSETHRGFGGVCEQEPQKFSGLTKLEYTIVQLATGAPSHQDQFTVSRANKIWDMIESGREQ